MRKFRLVLVALIFAPLLHAAPLAGTPPPAAPANWQSKINESMPLLGHRNWILIVDSAYPLQSSPGVETIETNASHSTSSATSLGAINSSIHVRPLLYMDKELPFVSDDDAPGASAYRTQVAQILRNYTIRIHPRTNMSCPDRRNQQAVPRPRPQNHDDHSLLLRLHPPRLQILVRRRRKTHARRMH